MKKFLLLLTLAVLSCSLPARLTVDVEGTPTPTAVFIAPTVTPQPPVIGSEKNPLILALAPAAHASPETVIAGEQIAAFIEARTGYRLVTMQPASEASLIAALDQGNVHIAALSPFGYLAAREQDAVTVILASSRSGKLFYGAQFIANRESEFVPYFDPVRDANTAEATDALRQFHDKKPCWSDVVSPSGYVMPLGVLLQNGVTPKEGAFLEGQASVVRAVYAGDICNFGATYIDARELPALEANYPDVSERVLVIWRIPEIIPYENISMSNNLPLEMRRAVQRAFIDLLLSPGQHTLLQQVYGMDEIQAVDDALYAEFYSYWQASGLELEDLLE